MAENYGSLTGTLDAHDTLEGNLDNHGEMSGEIQFGGVGSKVDDVLVNGESVVENKIAHIDLTPYAEIENVYDKTTIDTALQGKANVTDIPTDLSDLQDDASHRTVTDEEKTEWSGKADTSDIPTALSQLTNDADYVQDNEYQHTDNNYTDSDKNKLENIESGAEVNVQSDWNESNSSSDAYILNKPTIPSVVANPQNTTATLTSIGIDGTNYAVSGGGGGGAVNSVNGMTGDVVLDAENVGALPDDTPLFSGDYNDLTNKPTIPDAQIQSDWNQSDNTKVDFIKNKPTIPSAQIQSDWSQSDNSKVDYIKNKPSIPTALADLSDDSTHRVVTDSEKTTWNGKSDFSGSYTDLTDKPTLGTASALDVASSGDASTTEVVKGDDSRLTDARTPVSHTHTTSDITDFDISGKADKVSDATSGNFAGLDANGNLTDSGHKHSDYLTQHQDISGKADKVSSATNGNIAGLNASGNLTDSGISGDMTTTSATGNPISIADLKSAQIALNPVITFEPIQAGSGTPSPSNVRAISGYDKVEVLSCGKNLCEETITNATINADGTITASGSGTSFDMHVARVLQGVTYTIKSDEAQSVSQQFVGGFFYSKPALNSVSYNGTRLANTSATFTSPITGYVAFRTSRGYAVAQCEYGSSQTTYEPYHKTTDISESLGQTVYGLEYYPRTGKARVIKSRYDLGDLSWTYDSGSARFYSNSLASLVGGTVSGSIFTNVIFSCYKNSLDASNASAFIFENNKYVYVYDNRYTDAATFKTAIAGQTVCFELASPTEIQLTPHEIALSQGYNYISTNGTSISLAYHNGEVATHADVEQLAETVNELNDYLQRSNADSYVDLTTSAYIFPCDGYVVVDSQAVTSGSVRVQLVSSSGSFLIGGIYMNITGQYQVQTTYVKKGMNARVVQDVTGTRKRFIPLIP